jgi:hypothetical protein
MYVDRLRLFFDSFRQFRSNPDEFWSIFGLFLENSKVFNKSLEQICWISKTIEYRFLA